jgi:hypothetical protein
MKMSLILLSLLFLACAGAMAGDLNEMLLGKWQYVSVQTKEGAHPAQEGDYVEFRETEILWRWMGTDHRHRYTVQQVDGRNQLTGYRLSDLAVPEILGIFTIQDGDLIVCDRAAALGYPGEFSVEEGTLLRLRRRGAGKAE